MSQVSNRLSHSGTDGGMYIVFPRRERFVCHCFFFCQWSVHPWQNSQRLHRPEAPVDWFSMKMRCKNDTPMESVSFLLRPPSRHAFCRHPCVNASRSAGYPACKHWWPCKCSIIYILTGSRLGLHMLTRQFYSAELNDLSATSPAWKQLWAS